MKVLIASVKPEIYVTRRMCEEMEKAGIDYDSMSYSDFGFEFEKGETKILVNGEELNVDDYDAFVPRMSPPNYVYAKDILVRAFSDNGKFVANGETFLRWMYLNKFTQSYVMSEAGIDVVHSYVYPTLQSVDKSLFEEERIVKKMFGKQGKNVYKVDSESEFDELVKDEEVAIEKYLIQEYLPLKEDYRVLVIGGKALPVAMKRIAKGDDFLTNISQGGEGEKHEINDEMKEIAEKVAKAFKCDVCGVDIMMDKDGKMYVLEVNRSANFEGYESFVEHNVALDIINLIKEKAS